MPDSFGKRKRRDVKAKKAADRETRRVERNQRRADRAAGILEKGPPVAEAEEADDGFVRRTTDREDVESRD